MTEVTQKYLSSLVGKTVEFTPAVVDWDGYPECGMRAIVTKYRLDDNFKNCHINDVCHTVWLDFSNFEKINHPLQSANFYDSEGRPTKTAVEAGYYSPIDHFYIGGIVEELPFKVVDPDKEELELAERIFEAIYLKYIDSSRFAENNIKDDILKAIKGS